MFAVPRPIYIYQSSADPKRYGACMDATGANIPARFCPGGYWKLQRAFFLSDNDAPRLGIDHEKMKAALNENNWYVWEVEVRDVPLR